MRREKIINEYFEWMYDLVCGGRYAKDISYRKLLMQLHRTNFVYSIPMDENRELDGIDLRRRFAYDTYQDEDQVRDALIGPCSILEMMIALSIRIEEEIMDNPNIGNRTSQWFWGMVVTLGLGSMTDDNFDLKLVKNNLQRFLNRDYEPNGQGGLFLIRNCDQDLRKVEIWHQVCWYLDNIT